MSLLVGGGNTPLTLPSHTPEKTDIRSYAIESIQSRVEW